MNDKIYKRLESDLKELLITLKGEFTTIPGDAGGDAVDAAFNCSGGEVSSTIIHHGAKELLRIQRAMELCKQGKYGICDSCTKKIPAPRLKALPYTTMCVACQSEAEKNGYDEDDDDEYTSKRQDD